MKCAATRVRRTSAATVDDAVGPLASASSVAIPCAAALVSASTTVSAAAASCGPITSIVSGWRQPSTIGKPPAVRTSSSSSVAHGISTRMSSADVPDSIWYARLSTAMRSSPTSLDVWSSTDAGGGVSEPLPSSNCHSVSPDGSEVSVEVLTVVLADEYPVLVPRDIEDVEQADRAAFVKSVKAAHGVGRQTALRFKAEGEQMDRPDGDHAHPLLAGAYEPVGGLCVPGHFRSSHHSKSPFDALLPGCRQSCTSDRDGLAPQRLSRFGCVVVVTKVLGQASDCP